MSGLVTFNTTTGINVAHIGQIFQMQSTGTITALSTYSTAQDGLIFPYPWPWHGRVGAGDSIEHSQTSSWIILGLVTGVLGTWVAQIIVEQAIFSRRRGGLYHVWLAIVALALGGVGVWCNFLVQSTALMTKLPGASSNLSLSYSLDALLLALLPCLLLTFAGLWTAIGDVDHGSTDVRRAGRASEIGRALRDEKAAKKKAAALSSKQHLSYLVDCITWRAVLGGLLVAAAVVLTRVTLWSIWVQDADYTSLAWAWVLSLLIDVAYIPAALLMFIHALRWRILSVFVFAAAVMADWQIMLASMQFTYAPSRAAPFDSLHISSDVIVLVAGLIAAVIAFVFIGLLFHATRLSRNDLSVLVAEQGAAVVQLKKKAVVEAARLQRCWKDVVLLERSLEAVNVMSSLPQDYALAMTMFSSPQQSAPTRTSVVQPTERVLKPAGRSSSAVAPISPIAQRDSIQQQDTQSKESTETRTSVTHAAVTQTQADKELETKLETALSALTDSQSEASVEVSHVLSGASFSGGRSRIVSSSGQMSPTAKTFAGDDFQLSAPLLGKLSNDDSGVPSSTAPPSLPSMETIISHPVAVEVFKEELRKTQSVESLVFCLHVRRYRSVQSKKARRLLAVFICDAFVRNNSPQQININSRQRDTILVTVDKKDATCNNTLFDEADRECLLLMRTNVFKGFTATSGYRLCAWLCHSLDMKGVGRAMEGEVEAAQSDAASGVGEMSWVTGRSSKSGQSKAVGSVAES